MKFAIAVPARLNSSRLPNKVLADIGGIPMLQRVLIQASKVENCQRVVLCTDSDEIMLASKKWGFEAIMTSSECTSGTDRIASIVNSFDCDFVINLQGDQPFIDPLIISGMVNVVAKNRDRIQVITPIFQIQGDQIHDPNLVKVLLRSNGDAIYFSRSPLPFQRDIPPSDWSKFHNYWGHLGIYGYSTELLGEWLKFSPSSNEVTEKLEQLRLIDNAVNISTYKVTGSPKTFLAVDTVADLELAREMTES